MSDREVTLAATVRALSERVAAQAELLGRHAEGSVEVPLPPRGHSGYLALLREMADLHARKSADYGSDADPLANIRSAESLGIEPWRAAWLRAHDKIHRIDRYCQTGSLTNEGVQDSLMDLAAYTLIALALMREKQCWRRPELALPVPEDNE